jgi:hypothetical protein
MRICFMTCPSQSSSLGQSNDVWRRTQVINSELKQILGLLTQFYYSGGLRMIAVEGSTNNVRF